MSRVKRGKVVQLKKYFGKKLLYNTEDRDERPLKNSLLAHFQAENAERFQHHHRRAPLGLIYVSIADFYNIADCCGDELAFDVLDSLEYETSRRLVEFFPGAKHLFSERVGLVDNLLVLALPSNDPLFLTNGAHIFRLRVRETLNLQLLRTTGRFLDIMVGAAMVPDYDIPDADAAALKAYWAAKQAASAPADYAKLPLSDEYRAILDQGRITTLYQPVIEFETGATLGWEAFSRGPENSSLNNFNVLADFAEETASLDRLERLCRESAIRRLGKMEPKQRLFINVHPDTMDQRDFTLDDTMGLLREVGLEPKNVVLEVAETTPIRDESHFHKTLERFRGMGFQIAVDEVGASRTSLSTLARIRPDYMKVDISLIGRIDTNPYHRLMVETLVAMARKMEARIIAVGIETETELTSLLSMGVNAGQGNLLGEPLAERSAVKVALPAQLTLQTDGLPSGMTFTIRELVRSTLTVPPEATVRQVKEMLADKPPQSSVVVVRGNKAVGLLMHYKLDQHLSTQFGLSLYYHRQVAKLMDSDILIVDADQPGEEVAQMAMKREGGKTYDDIVVQKDGALLGIVSVQQMLDAMAVIQVELAKGANPLSGLPGNVAIEREIDQRVKHRTPTAIIYADLDNFKVYNDVYGFDAGDNVILLCKKSMVDAFAQLGRPEDFLGHVGGDDFVGLVHPERASAICEKIIQIFAEGVPPLYNEEDRERGFIVGKGRDGQVAEFGLVSLSLAVIDCGDFLPPFSMEALSRRTAQVKKAAKAVTGNSYVTQPLKPEQ